MEFNLFKVVNNGTRNVIEFETRLPFESVVWKEKFVEAGTVQAVFAKTDETLALLKVGKFCTLSPAQGANLAYIHSIKINGDKITVYGSEAKALWKRKGKINLAPEGTVSRQAKIEAALKSAMFTFADDDVIIPNLGTANLDALEYASVYEYVCEILESASAGWTASLDEQSGTIRIFARKGVDKSDTVQFASIFGNAADYSYTADSSGYANSVTAVGLDGKAIVTETVTRTGDTTGETYSAYLDLRTEFPRGADVTLADYKAALRERAQMSLIARYVREKLDVGDVSAEGFGTDYALGDIVAVYIHELGLNVNCRVTSSTRVIEDGLDTTTISLEQV